MTEKNEICELIRTVYPDIGVCGIDMDADYDEKTKRWTVTLKRAGREFKKHLEPGEAELCLAGTKCLNFVMEINELKNSIDAVPLARPGEDENTVSEKPICNKAPELAEHYRMEDEDLPCDDGRAGGK